jgi:hypothetical protein
LSFDPNARLDPGQVTDVRGRTGRGGGAVIAGGGGIGLILAIAFILLGGDPSALINQQPGGGQVTGPENTTLQQECQSGTDASERADCRIVGYVNSIQEFWDGALPDQLGKDYPPTNTILFDNAVDTGCGTATSQVGPFYCPPDQHVYLDLGFFAQLEQLGAEGGRFAEAYVVAHEYGHHIENVLGILGRAQTGDTGEGSAAVKIELMADCLAGVWAHNAEGTGAVLDVTEDDIATALDAAAAVGDDRIQERTQGQVNPEAWTHGSAEQRQAWFTQGFESGDARNCDTFAQ